VHVARDYGAKVTSKYGRDDGLRAGFPDEEVVKRKGKGGSVAICALQIVEISAGLIDFDDNISILI